MQNALLGHSAILLTCIKQVMKANFGLLFEWPFKTGFTVSGKTMIENTKPVIHLQFGAYWSWDSLFPIWV